MNNSDIEKFTPKSMNQSKAWSPEGKASKAIAHHWSYLPEKVRKSEPKKWVSKNKEHQKAVMAFQFNKNKQETK